VIKRFIMHAKKTAFVVEHDFIMATYLADRVIVYDGKPGVETTAHSPQVNHRTAGCSFGHSYTSHRWIRMLSVVNTLIHFL
jgi:translation initiation factor RLI1